MRLGEDGDRDKGEGANKGIELPTVKVMGIDPSLNSTGIAMVTKHVPHDNVESKIGVIGAKSAREHIEKLYLIGNMIKRYVEDFDPTLIVMEGYSFGSTNGREVAGEVRGAMYPVLWDSGYSFEGTAGKIYGRIVLVSPGQLKKFATGSHKADKDMIRLQVYKRWRFESETNDAVDAYVLARIGLAWLDQAERAALTKCQEEVIQAVFEPKEKAKKGKGKESKGSKGSKAKGKAKKETGEGN